MQHKELNYMKDNTAEYKKSSNKFIGVTFAVMAVIVAVGMIFG